MGLGSDRTREIQNFENQGTSMHGPSPAGASAGLRLKTPASAISLPGYPETPRTPTPFSGKMLCQSNLRLPSPKAWALLVLLWGRDQVSVRTSGGQWRRSGGVRGTGKEDGGTEVPGPRAPRRELAVPPSERHRPARGGPQGRSAGESGRAKPRGCREEARVAGTRGAVIKASSLHPRHPLGLLRLSEAEAPRCRS